MTTLARTAPTRRSSSSARRPRPHRWAVVTAVALGVLALALGFGVRAAQGPGGAPAAGPLVPTGAVNDMGMPVVGTPGFASDVATAAGVEVTGATWHLGTVPLDVAVRPTWTLTNTGDAPVTLGQPVPEVREGCCPGLLTLGTTTLATGESTTLTFELAMHQGMDGWHDLAVHVPIESAAGADHLVVAVDGDFTG